RLRVTKYCVNIGNVAPISSVGKMTSARVVAATPKLERWSVCVLTHEKTSSDASPNTPIMISTKPKSLKRSILRVCDSEPPSRLPNPNPSRNPVTTTAPADYETPHLLIVTFADFITDGHRET